MYTEDGHTRKVCAPLCTVVRDTCGVNVPVSCQRKLCIPSLAVSSIVLKPLMKVFTLLLTREPLKHRMLFCAPALARGRPKSHADHFLHTMGTDGHLYLAMLGPKRPIIQQVRSSLCHVYDLSSTLSNYRNLRHN